MCVICVRMPVHGAQRLPSVCCVYKCVQICYMYLCVVDVYIWHIIYSSIITIFWGFMNLLNIDLNNEFNFVLIYNLPLVYINNWIVTKKLFLMYLFTLNHFLKFDWIQWNYIFITYHLLNKYLNMEIISSFNLQSMH